MKKLALFLLFSCSSNLKIDYSNEGVSQLIKTDDYIKAIKRYRKDDEKIISKIETKYEDAKKGKTIDYYLLTSISENSIYKRLTNIENIWTKNYHNIGSFLNLLRHLEVEIENNKFKKIILTEDKDDLKENSTGKYGGKRYEINKLSLELLEGYEIKTIVFKNNEDEVITISYKELEIKEDIFVEEKEIENCFPVKVIIRNEEKEVIGVYYHFYDNIYKNSDLNEILPFADNPKDIKLTLVRNKDITTNEKIKVSNSFRISYNGNIEIIKGKDEKIFYENIANSSDEIENVLSFYTILDKKEFLNLLNK